MLGDLDVRRLKTPLFNYPKPSTLNSNPQKGRVKSVGFRACLKPSKPVLKKTNDPSMQCLAPNSQGLGFRVWGLGA